MKAPDFILPDQHNKLHNLADYRGKWLVLYFYPKDNTAGCTLEACSFRDERTDIAALGAEVVGVSKDSVVSHANFAEKHNLNFVLLSDTSGGMIKAYGAWGLKKFMGREFEGVIRKTIIISPKGEVAKEYPKVTPIGHAKQIINDLILLQKEK